MTWILLALGLVLLTFGAELLVRGASRLAIALGITPLVVGLTVVAYGTSAPEMAVSAASSLSGSAEVALGNVVGSNVFNVLVVLGLSALVSPLVVSVQLIRLDVPLMIGASVLALLLALDGRIGRVDGTVLLLLAIAYTAFVVRQGRREGKAIASAREVVVEVPVRPHWGRDVLLIVGGLVLLVLGARWLVASATTIARDLGISELVIGLTIVAAGTSLPEVATSVVASLRGERDIAVGNVVGSNLFNVLMVLGLAGELAPGGLAVSPAVLRFDLPVMVAVAVACLPIFFTGHLVARWEGALFLGYYALYLAYLLLSATGHAALGPFRAAMLWFVLPLTAITLATLSARAWRAPRDGARAA